MTRILVALLLLAAPLPAAAGATVSERAGGMVLEAAAVPLDAVLDLLAVRFGFVVDWPGQRAGLPLLEGVYAGSLPAVLDQLLQGRPHGIVGVGGRIVRVSIAGGDQPAPRPALPAAAVPVELPGLAASLQAVADRPRPSPLKDQFGISP